MNTFSYESNDFNCCEVLTSKDEKFLRSCALHGDEEVRRDVALNENISKKIVSILIKDESVTIRRALAINESISSDSLYVLAQDADEEVRRNAIDNKKLNDIHMILLAKSTRDEVKSSLASKYGLPCKVLDIFSKDPDPKYRVVAARGRGYMYHPNEDLCFDPDDNVRAALALNSKISARTLLILSRDSSLKVLRSLAMNRDITKEIRQNLANTRDRDICWHISTGEMYPETCQILYELGDRLINYNLSNNSSTPIWIIKELAESDDKSTKECASYRLKRIENK